MSMATIIGIVEYIMSSSYIVANIIFAIVAVIALIFSIVFLFHWRKYGMGGVVLAVMEILYLVVAAALLLIAFFSI